MAGHDETNGWIFTDAAHDWMTDKFAVYANDNWFRPEGFFSVIGEDDFGISIPQIDQSWWVDAARSIPPRRRRGRREG